MATGPTNPGGPKRPPLRKKRNNNKGPNNNWLFWVILGFIILIMMSQSTPMPTVTGNDQLTYSEFFAILKENNETGRIKSATLIESTENTLKGIYADDTTFALHVPKNDEELISLLKENVPEFKVAPAETFWSQVFFSFTPIILILLFIWFLSHRGSQMGNKIWSFGKSKAKMKDKDEKNITFKNVAGVDEAKEELQEVIEFLKDPKRFEKLGGKIPKGVLLIGPPGTGKTLLAKAVAGEAGVPFFSLSGSDFVEMFVGVGASRVRDLFEQGRKASKTSGKGAIIFIDEIDAVGRQRFTGIGGGNDEREQTLNALLVEMDGFNSVSGLILIAATNRPDTLDPALLRPGRFDRQVTVGLPDINGREGVLKVHCKNIKVDSSVNLRRIAQQTVSFSGADLANVCNEAALLAARKNKKSIEMEDFSSAVERVTIGPEKKSRVISQKEKEMTAYHEAGHAILSMLLPEVDTFTKVSIVPRGMAGGYTLTPPTEDKHYYNKQDLTGQMVVLLGGLVAEEIHVGDTSTGVSNDLERVANIARNMICVYGMNEKLGPLAYGQNQHQRFLGRDFLERNDMSEETSRIIDDEVRNLVNQAYTKAKNLLKENHDKLNKMAQQLMVKETMDIDDALDLFNMPKPKTDEENKPITEEPSDETDGNEDTGNKNDDNSTQ